ncbi:MAG: macro domain-containing protein [Clostridium sp.]|nr:macro domain-containing protein [Clostridium sp.]
MFEVNADCLINTVNCEGYMGKGIAYQFKMRFPMNNSDYVKACRSGILRPGKMHFFKENNITIVNFPTKDRWREKSKLRYVEEGMEELVRLLPKLEVKKIAIPPLGCGNGGLIWDDVKNIILKHINSVSDKYDFLIFEPSRNYVQKPTAAPKLYLSSLVVMQIRMGLPKNITALRFQKTAFLVNYFYGEEYFKFDKYKLGPYSHSLEVITKEIGEFQKYYNLDNTQETYEMVYKILCSSKIDGKLEDLKKAIDLSVSYVKKIRDNKALEGVCTVLYLIQIGFDNSVSDITNRFQSWSKDKKDRFSIEEIESYISYLEDTGIIMRNIIGSYEVVKWKVYH